MLTKIASRNKYADNLGEKTRKSPENSSPDPKNLNFSRLGHFSARKKSFPPKILIAYS